LKKDEIEGQSNLPIFQEKIIFCGTDG